MQPHHNTIFIFVFQHLELLLNKNKNKKATTQAYYKIPF